MRKLAPAFVIGTLVALSSGTALAFGDMNKSKKSPAVETTAPMPPAATAPNTPKATGPANASEPGQTGNAASAPGVSTSSVVPSTNLAAATPVPAARCEGLSKNDPNYKLNGCDATPKKGAPGEASGASSGSAGGSGDK